MAPLEIKRVLLDPGHGPNNRKAGIYDPGAMANHYGEHVIVAGIVSKIATINERRFSAPFSILVLPEIGLASLVHHVNRLRKDGDILVSLHMNAGPARANGCEVIVSETAPPLRRHQAATLSKVLAREIGLRDRGVKLDSETPRQRLSILRDTYLPAFLVELGFITNLDDVSAVLKYGVEGVFNAIMAIKTE